METSSSEIEWDRLANTLETYCDISETCDIKIIKDGHGVFSVIVPGKDSYARDSVQKTLILLEQLTGLGHKIPSRVMDRIMEEGLLAISSTEDTKDAGVWVSVPTSSIQTILESISTKRVNLSIQVLAGFPSVVIFPDDKDGNGHILQAKIADF